jgi:virginiamycin B lyase
MSQRWLSFAIVAALACATVLVLDQRQLLDENYQYAIESLGPGLHETGRGKWQGLAAATISLGTLPRSHSFVAVKHVAQSSVEQPKPEAAGTPGGVEVSIKEWIVPTPGSHPHDPFAAQDGSIWYTGQMANLLGRLGPKTGEFTEYRLKTPESGPHGLVADKDGNIWFTANFKGYIGKLDPKTGEISEYPMPDPKARDPHTPVFDQKGTLWFTVQGGNMVGRLVPQGAVAEVVGI